MGVVYLIKVVPSLSYNQYFSFIFINDLSDFINLFCWNFDKKYLYNNSTIGGDNTFQKLLQYTL